MNRLTRACRDATGLNLCTTYTYDRLGNRLTDDRPQGRDDAHRDQRLRQADAQVEDDGGLSAEITSYVYDNNLNLVAISDDNGHATRYTYDGRNQLAGDPLRRRQRGDQHLQPERHAGHAHRPGRRGRRPHAYDGANGG